MDSNQHRLHIFAHNGSYSDVLEFLNEGKIDIEAQDPKGKTALHLAAEEGHYQIVELLLQRGAKIDTKDHAGYTPLKLAQEKGHITTKVCLVRWGERPQKQGSVVV
jgi:ankyrin repeat protein